MDFRAKNRKVRQGESGFSEPNEAILRRKDARIPTRPCSRIRGTSLRDEFWSEKEDAEPK